ncbi:MAG: response regulator [Candidatus Omnitrophica bacterium]|nr:response regulator [Candidatus Omnitrophota bacterium]
MRKMLVVDSKVKQILIVEDNRDMQELYKIFFSDQQDKYSIDIESRADVALKKIKEKTYDLIILDIIMEPMTGESFFSYARQEVKTVFTPILVVSVLSPDTLVKLKKINHVDFLQKPITKEQLMQKIKERFWVKENQSQK